MMAALTVCLVICDDEAMFMWSQLGRIPGALTKYLSPERIHTFVHGGQVPYQPEVPSGLPSSVQAP